MKKPTEKDIQVFSKLIKEFYKKCLDENIVVVPSLGMSSRGIYPHIDFSLVNKKEKEMLEKELV